MKLVILRYSDGPRALCFDVRLFTRGEKSILQWGRVEWSDLRRQHVCERYREVAVATAEAAAIFRQAEDPRLDRVTPPGSALHHGQSMLLQIFSGPVVRAFKWHGSLDDRHPLACLVARIKGLKLRSIHELY